MSVWPSLNHAAVRRIQKAEALFFLVGCCAGSSSELEELEELEELDELELLELHEKKNIFYKKPK